MPKSTHISFVTHLLLSELKVKVNKTTLLKCMESHSDYPSLLTICDCLTTFNVSNHVYQIKKEDYKESDLSYPFITHFSKNGGSFILVHGIEEGQIIFSDEKNDKSVILETAFLQHWNGILLYAVAHPSSGESHFYQNRMQSIVRPLALLLLIIIGMLLPVLCFIYSSNWLVFSLLIINYLGLVTCIFLLRNTINANDPILNRLCGKGEINQCNVILNSPAAKITPWLSWSEVGFFYFSGCYLFLLVNPVLVSFLFWINLITIPFVFYSLIYQYLKKLICLLCCLVQVLLIAEFIILNFSLDNTAGMLRTNIINTIISNHQMINLGLCFMLPILFWITLKPILLKASSVARLNVQLNRFKHNSELFAVALTKQAHYTVGHELNPIILGKPDSEHIITLISNPMCGPCGHAHRFLNDWTAWNTDLKVQILFIAYNDQQEKIVRHLLALNLQRDQQLMRKSLSDWYDHIDQTYENWAAKYPVLLQDRAAQVYAHQKKWMEQTNITYTPTIFVDGYLLPEPYQLEDLKFLINYL